MKNKKINILYVHANNDDVGGADYCLFKLASELDKKKFNPTVCLSQETDIVGLYRSEGIKTYIVKMLRIKKTKNPFELLNLATQSFPTIYRLLKIIDKEKIDIIHGNDLLDIYGPVAGRLAGKKVTQYVRWILVSPLWLKRLIAKLVYSINDIILTVSNGVSKEMFSKNGTTLPNISTCYDWIDMDRVGHSIKNSNIRKELDIDANIPIVGCVGRLEPWKGQDIFIKAAAIVAQDFPETKFLIVGGEVQGRGRESYTLYLKKLINTLKLDDKIIFSGHRTDIANLMNTFDIFVHSSTTPDPLPGVVMEAMSCSAPVVGADAGGVPEEVKNGVTGLLYEPGNHIEMAEKISYLLKNPETAQKMGERGKHRVKIIFDKKNLCSRIEQHYVELLKN